MLARYKIYRGKSYAKLPDGIRQDTRKHTRHCLRPPEKAVWMYLNDPSLKSWREFSASYVRSVEERYAADPTPFNDLANLAVDEDVYLGCSCPTAKNPDVQRCHTVLALKFMKQRYPALDVEFP